MEKTTNNTLELALAEEFWKKNVGKIINSNTISFFSNKVSNDNEKTKTTVKVPLNTDNVNEIHKICNDSDILLYTFYASVLEILLSRYEGDNEILFLSPVNQFDCAKEKDHLFFKKQNIDKKQSFKELFSSNKQQLLAAIKQGLPWSFVDNCFKGTSISNAIRKFGLIIGKYEYAEDVSIPENQFRFQLEGEKPYLEVCFSDEKLSKELITIFGDNFKNLLGEVLRNLYQPVDSLNCQGKIEKELLETFNLEKLDFPLDKNVVEIIDQQAIDNGDKVAICHQDEKVTYRELFHTTNKFGRYFLENFEAKQDDLYGIMLSRSITMVESILGVWKSGSAYVPIGVNLPDEHLTKMITDSKLKAIITDDQNSITQLNRLDVDVEVIDLNKIRKEVNKLPSTKVDYHIDPEALAYVIYTSGSTGKPKGVMIEHLGMINHLGAKISEMSIVETSVVAQNAPHTFDISVWQMFAPLVAGATSIIYDKEVVVDVERFVKKLVDDEVRVLELVPSYLLEMLRFLEDNVDKKINVPFDILILNAETLTKSMVQRWLKMYPNIPIVNTYGATEASDDISHYIMNKVPDTYSVPVMKGPIQNFEVHLVDKNMKPVPIGVKGEILISGSGVGRGYLNDPERTQKAFIKEPIPGTTLSKRTYKTGDIGRYLSDGTMEFIGRDDNQVKIRGHRVELDAIENVLSTIPEIKNSKTIAHIDKQIIVAYYLSDTSLDDQEVKNILSKKLPEYMLPSICIHMKTFPLTTNGKINTKLLPDPDDYKTINNCAFVGARNETEKKVIEIWEKILNKERIGIKDDFFELGGHSLKMNRLKNEYHKEFNVRVEFKDLFKNSILEFHSELIMKSYCSEYKEIPRLEDNINYPISDAQRRLWVLSRFEKGSAVYNMSSSIALEGDYSIDILRKAIDATITRHEILRTVFKTDDKGELRQWVQSVDKFDFKIKYKDYTYKKNSEIIIKEFIADDAQKPFNLEKGPLLRASIFKTGKDRYIFYYNMHHIISDGWSTKVLVKDVLEYYNAYRNGETPNLPELKIQYKDYSSWQINQLQNGSYDEHKAYWIKNLSKELPLIDLPTQLKRPKIKTHNGRGLQAFISKDTTQRLKSFCHDQGGTLFMGLLTCWNILLHRYTDKNDIVLGTPIAGRDHIDLENQIGFYVNTIALRNQVNPNDNFVDLFNKVKNSTLDAYAHQMYPFDRLVEDLNLKWDTSRSALFDIMFVFENSDEKLENTNHSNDQIQDLGSQVSKFDLDLLFKETTEGLYFNILYNTDVYEQNVVKNLMLHFKQLLINVLSNTDEKVGQIDYLTKEEVAKIVYDFNANTLEYPKNKTIVDLFVEQVQNTPNNIAITFEDKELTYQELDDVSNQMANYIAENHQVQNEELIGVKLESSDWLIVTLLAVLKSGGTYLPIDPNYPKERIQYIVNDSNCRLCIDNVILEKFIDKKKKYSKNYTSPIVSINNLAYVIYTSGSTGKPKGVMIEHKGIMNTILSQIEFFGVTKNNSGLLFASISFDASISEIFMILLSGAKLCVINKDERYDHKSLEEFMNRTGVDIATIPPSYLRLMEIQNLKTLKTLITAGESPIYNKVQEFIKQGTYYNAYGPTETSICSSMFKVDQGDVLRSGTIPIGRPMANTSAYILDSNNNIVPIGVVGEICIGGAGLARGYLNRPKLTAEKFVNQSFVKEEKLYKTGDLGMWLSDGTIEFLGRRDDQVKLRGYRIELGEIENLLRNHERVEDVMVLIKDNDLFAYIVSEEDNTVSDLRSYLKITLPDYMIPTHFIRLDMLPLTANGKIDKNALPNPKESRLETGIEYVAPRNEKEKQIVNIIVSQLEDNIQKVGVFDNFFDIGVNSIKIIKITEGLNKKFGLDLKVVSLFEYSNISELVNYINSITKEGMMDEIEADIDIIEDFDEIIDLI